MANNLSIKPASEEGLDFLSLGALVTRLDPGLIPFAYANHYDLHVSGGEYNVAANLSRCFGLKTGICSAMVKNPIGDRVRHAVQESGVQSFYKYYEHNGVTGPNMAQVWSDQGKGTRAPVVFYNRSDEAAARLSAGDIDWKRIFSKGVRWFHSGGIFSALSDSTPELIIEGMKAAKAAGAIVSFDLNFRAKIWKYRGGVEKAPEVFKDICQYVDVLVGNEEDLQKGLGIKGPEVDKKSKLDTDVFFSMIDSLKKEYPNIQAVATTLREVEHTNRHQWSAVLHLQGENFQAPQCELSVLDRVGGGDGFAAGLIYGLLAGKSSEEALKLGWAHGALMTTFPGDISMATLEQVEAFADGGSARIQR